MISQEQAIQIGSDYILRRFKCPMKVSQCRFRDPEDLFQRIGERPPPGYYIGASRRVWAVAFEAVFEVRGRLCASESFVFVDVDAETGEPYFKEPALY